jgi:thiamine biosynthesis protein ThiS
VSNQPSIPHISITINGEAALVPTDLNILDLLAHLGLDPARVAVELDRLIVRRPEWATTRVEAGARFEIVTFVGGG